MGMNWSHAQPNARAAGIFLARKFHITTVYCYDYRPNTADPSQLSDHAFGAADDFMGGGWDLAKYAQAHARAMQITYIIHDRKIWSVARSGEGWRPYTGPNPHTDHVHISFIRTSANLHLNIPGNDPTPDNTAPGSTPGNVGGATVSNAGFTNVANLPGPIDNLVTFLASPGLWLRLLMFLGGIILVILATGSIGLSDLQKVSAS